MGENFMIIKTKKMSPREVKKKLHDFIDGISEDCGPEIEGMAEELKAHGDEFVDALSGNYRSSGGGQYRWNGSGSGNYRANDGQGFRNGGGYSHSFRNGGYGGYKGELRDDVQMRDDVDWNEKEKQRQQENKQKLEQLEAEMRRLKMRMDNY